jgi:hypothetical protein
MTRALLTAVASIVGFVQGVVLFAISRFSFDDPFSVSMSGEWLDQSSLICGGIGALCGAAAALAVVPSTRKSPGYESIPDKLGAPPYQGPLGLPQTKQERTRS